MKKANLVKMLVGLAALLLIFGAVASWSAYTRLEGWIEDLREAGDPASLADLERKDVDPDSNAATYLARVADDAEQLYNEIHPYAHPDGGMDWRAGLNDAQIEKIREGFDAYPRVFATLELAGQCEQYDWPRDYAQPTDAFLRDYLESVNRIRNFARLHDARARYLATIGKPREAVMTCLQQLKFCRLQDAEPLLVGFLVNVACRSTAVQGVNGILWTAELTEDTHQAIEEELAKHDSMHGIIHALKTDRAFGLESFRGMSTPMIFKKRQISEYLDVLNQQIAMGAKSRYELTGVEPVEARRAHAKNMQPALQAAREAMNRLRSTIRCLRVLNALHRRDQDADEVDIQSLGLPREITIDPYNGKPLNIRPTDDGWIVYAVGKDGEDGGGQLKDFADVGVGPPEIMD